MKKLLAILLIVVLTFAFTACAGGPAAKDPSPSGTPETAATPGISFPSRGAQVPAIVEIPGGDGSFPLVVLVHGHGGDKNEGVGFVSIAAALKAEGIASIRMDFPGCGESAEGFQKNSLTNMKQDVLNAIVYAAENYPIDTAKVGIFGYSMGGRIALELLGEGAYGFVSAALLAPASNNDFISLFGGVDAWEAMKAAAEKDGFAVNPWRQELSKEWFGDLEKVTDPAKTAAEKFTGPAVVIYSKDDNMVSPSVSAAAAAALKSEVVDATGDGHFYGFFGERTGVHKPEVLNVVVNGVAGFFAKTLK